MALKQAGVDYVQIDASQIGSTIEWYPIQMLFHSSSDRLALAGVPIQVPNQQKISREEYLAYMRALVLQFGLEVRTYERVERAQRTGSTFELRTRLITGGERTYRVENVVLAIGAFHAPRLLGIPGEDMPHVSHYFRDPHTYFGKRLLIIGGRNSAVEAAVRCQRAGANVTLSYRRDDFDPKVVKFWLLPEVRALIRDGYVRFLPRTEPVEIRAESVLLRSDKGPLEVPGRLRADHVRLHPERDAVRATRRRAARRRSPTCLRPRHDGDERARRVRRRNGGRRYAAAQGDGDRRDVPRAHPRIVGAITGRPAVGLPAGDEDE